MKKIISGGIVATLFVAGISSCGNTPTPNPIGHNSKAVVTLTCLNNTCPGLTASSTDSSTHVGGTKYVFIVKSTADIPANTDLRIEVDATDSAVAY
jgi:hypothetical protein